MDDATTNEPTIAVDLTARELHVLTCAMGKLAKALTDLANAIYVPCIECEGDGCHGPNPAEDGCKRCAGSGCEPDKPDIFGPAGLERLSPEDVAEWPRGVRRGHGS